MAVSGEREPSGLYVIRISGVFTNEQRKENVNEAYKQKNQQAPASSEKRKN